MRNRYIYVAGKLVQTTQFLMVYVSAITHIFVVFRKNDLVENVHVEECQKNSSDTDIIMNTM